MAVFFLVGLLFSSKVYPFISLYIQVDFEKLKGYLDPVLLSQRLQALQTLYSLKDRRLR